MEYKNTTPGDFDTTTSDMPIAQQSQDHQYNVETIQNWLLAKVATALEIDPVKIDVHKSFVSFGLQSMDAVGLSGDLEEWLGRTISPTIVYDYPNIAQLAHYLAKGPRVSNADDGEYENSEIANEPIAIIGMGCRFPGGANSPDTFWDLLKNGHDAISPVPLERWNVEEFYSADLDAPGKMYTRHGGFLQDIDKFDASFFGLSPHEATQMDPQQRLLVEVAWEALEDAGQRVDQLSGSLTGVFVGYMNNHEYSILQMQQEDTRYLDDPYFGIGSSSSIASGRLSYLFNFQGPAITVDTACSSSLVSVHLASQSLRNRECNMALVGGVNALLLPESMINACKMRMLAVDGHCKTFDADADGFVIGEGCGFVVLKRLSDAQAHHDTILAVVHGSAVNQDGRSNGITAPNRLAQESVIRRALAHAKVEPTRVGYVEAHGSGTVLGDPIEIEAITTIFGKGRQPEQHLLVGAVKTNIGHLAGAAGIAGLIKTVLILQHKEIPPHLNLRQPNPHIAWQDIPIEIPTEPTPWLSETEPRFAGINSFGWSGTNAHVVLSEAPQVESSPASRPWQLLLLSAKTPTALENVEKNLCAYLQREPTTPLADVAYTYQTKREAFPYRQIAVCRTSEEARRLLGIPQTSPTQQMGTRSITFLFPGVGDHYVHMAYQLYQEEPVFRACFDDCAKFLQPYLGLDIRNVLYPQQTAHEGGKQATPSSTQKIDLRRMLRRDGLAISADAQKLNQTEYAQPILFVIEYALAQLWISWGIRPQAMIGYSLGEYTAACLADVFSLPDALKLVAKRSQLIQQVEMGAMLAVALTEAEVSPLLSQDISLAIVNGPSMCVVAGPISAIEALQRTLQSQDIACQRLQTTHAFHSTMMRTIADTFMDILQMVPLLPPQIPYISNVTGTWIQAEEVTNPAYWVNHLCQTVRFGDGIKALCQKPKQILLEIGPGQMLSSLVLQHITSSGLKDQLVLQTLKQSYDPREDLEVALQTLGKIWQVGGEIDWARFYAREQRKHVSLPTYPFERQRHWIKLTQTRVLAQTPQPLSMQKKPDHADWFYQPLWKSAPLENKLSNRVAQEVWLVLLDDAFVGDQLSAHLAQQGHRVITVRPGTNFAHASASHFEIRPHERADYEALLQTLRGTGQVPNAILHCWNMTPYNPTCEDTIDFQVCQNYGFYSLLALTQALEEQSYEETIRLVVLLNQAQAVTGTEKMHPEQATMLGACKVIAQEYSNINCYCIDIEVPEAGMWSGSTLIDQVYIELTQPSEESIEVAYRGNQRWVLTFIEQRIELADNASAQLRRQGVYVITGGLGGVGLVLAEYLAKTVQARLVLVGRSGLPERSDWEYWQKAHAHGDRISRRIRSVQKLEELGAEVLVLRANVADPDQLQRVIDQVYATFGNLHGVLHCAGSTARSAFTPIQSSTALSCDEHFQAKVLGVLALESALQKRSLDFCLLFSSISTILGGLGFVAYAAANAFMDSYVHMHNQISATPWTSVNWDTWQASSDGEQSPAVGATVAVYAMTPEEGCDTLLRVLSTQGFAQIIHSTGNLDTRIQQWVRRNTPVGNDRVKETRALAASTTIRTVPNNDYEQRIAIIWKEALGVERVGRNDNFFDLGGNSLIGLQVISRIKREFQIQIPAVALYEAPTIDAIVRYLQPDTKQDSTSQREHLSERRKEAHQTGTNQDIAIIGMSGRFPGAPSVEQFWQNLCAGLESITFFSEDELRSAGVEPSLLQRPNYVKARPILEQVDQFDAAFFGYSPREAALMDPQHRLFLECAWEALEAAGYDTLRYEGLIGVYGGTNISTYLLRSLATNPMLAQTLDDYQIVISNDKDSLTTSTSYKLNLKGPSYAVQTFCSTSLVATHLACQSLLAGESDIALAGGVSVRVPTKAGYLYQEGGMESPDGHCRTFDAQARGSLFGDGVGVVVLKRLADAQADGDLISAVIKGSAINNDGSFKVSYTAPSVIGQSEVVSMALAHAHVNPETVSYIEAHGTATELGDPIELSALMRAFRKYTDKRSYCAIGSVKTNVGHLDRAAGVAGLIKVALMLQQRKIPPSLHYTTPNPEIDFERSPFFVNTALTEWESHGEPLRAGINSLGMGGTNAHVVLEEPPIRDASSPSRQWQLLVFSAKTESALHQVSHNLQAYLQQNPETPLADIAYTLQIGRRRFEHRSIVVCNNQESAIAALNQAPLNHTSQHTARAVAFVFSGGIEHYSEMMYELYKHEAGFQRTVKRCSDLLKRSLQIDLIDLFYAEKKGERLPVASIPLMQAASFVSEYAMAQLFIQWGISPQAMIGCLHGEYVAACIAGVISLADALLLVCNASNTDVSVKELVQGMILKNPQIPYISQRTGTWITSEQIFDLDYWQTQRHAGEKFEQGMHELVKANEWAILEIGPAGAFASWFNEQGEQEDLARIEVISALSHPSERLSGIQCLVEALGSLWMAGVEVDWASFYTSETRQRVLLPTYPFERQRHWIDPYPTHGQGAAAPEDLEAALTTLTKQDFSRWFYQPSWKQVRSYKPFSLREFGSDLAQTWLLLTDGYGLGEQIQKSLLAHNQEVIVVAAGDRFIAHTQHAYSVDPSKRADYEALFDELRRQSCFPTQIVHLWSITASLPSAYSSKFVGEILRSGFESLFLLTQALGDANPEHCSITILSNALHVVLGDEEVCPEKATLIGPCQVIPLEYENMSCRSIDIQWPSATRENNMSALLSELTSEASEPIVALRGSHRWVPYYEELQVVEPEPTARLLRDGGTYLITGGLGGIGLAMAKHLARSVTTCKLALVSRTGLPPRSEWPQLLDEGKGTQNVQRQIRQIEALENLGAEVLVIAADVTNERQMRDTIQQVVATFGSLQGVIHAAGMPGIGIIRTKTLEAARKVLAPKVQGTLVLEQVLQEREASLDFLVLFSSIASETGGGPGQADYCAANAFLNAYAQKNHQRHGVTLAVDWGEWQWNAWEYGTESYDAVAREFLAENRRRIGITFEEGAHALEQILHYQMPQVVVSPQDFPALVALSKLFTTANIVQQARRRQKERQMHARPQLSTPYVAPESELESKIAMVWQGVLGITQVGVNDNFFDLGGNSLVGIELIIGLRKVLQREEIATHIFYECSTVGSIAQYLEQEQSNGLIDQRQDQGERRRTHLRQRLENSERLDLGSK